MARHESTAHPSRALVAQVLVAGLYLAALALLVQGIAHGLIMGGTGAPVGSIRWRFGFIGSVFHHLAYPMLGLTVASLTAGLTARRGFLWLIGLTQAALTAAAAGAFVVFLLDAAQIGAVVPPELRGKYTLTIAQTSVNAVVAIVLLAVLAVGTIRSARHMPPRREERRAAEADLLIGTSTRPGA